MKKFVKIVAASALALSLSTVSAMAGDKFFQFSLIGHPGNETDVLKQNADNSNGRAIMVPLQTTDYHGKKIDGEMVCEFSGDTLMATDVDGNTVEYIEDITDIDGAKLYFEQGDKFGIIDRDATDDGGAAIMVPSATGPEGDQVWEYDVYVRVLGKPNKCMNVSGWADDGDNWFKAGDISFNRKSGKPVRVNANELFEVDYCQLNADGVTCDTKVETYSVFDSIFSNYAWNIQNDGVRNLQVRIYPKAPAPE